MSSGVIIGYDGSECAKAALRAALDVSRAYGDKLTIAYGYEPSPVTGDLRDYQAALRARASERIAEAVDVAAAAGADVDGVIVEHAPAEGLAHLAARRDARVIVVGTRGESPLRGAILGSTPHKLLQVASRPVLVVPE